MKLILLYLATKRPHGIRPVKKHEKDSGEKADGKFCPGCGGAVATANDPGHNGDRESCPYLQMIGEKAKKKEETRDYLSSKIVLKSNFKPSMNIWTYQYLQYEDLPH